MKFPMIVLCTAAFASGAVMANDEPRTTQDFTDLFKTADANADGEVNKEEAAAHPGFQKNFDALDGNHDGKVTEKEFLRNTRPKHKD